MHRSLLSILWSIVTLLGVCLTGCTTSSDTTPPSTAKTDPAATSAPPVTATPADPAEGEDADFILEPDFQRLTLADFTPFPSDSDAWSEQGTLLRCAGKPRGYLSSREPFQNFTWRLDYRFTEKTDDPNFPGNTGFLVYIAGEPKIWPLCLEVQGKYAEMGAIKENGGAEPPPVEDHLEQRLAARKPAGEWNSLEIVSKDGALTVSINGQSVNASQPNFLSAGSIGIQAENFPFEVRRLRIRRDPTDTP